MRRVQNKILQLVTSQTMHKLKHEAEVTQDTIGPINEVFLYIGAKQCSHIKKFFMFFNFYFNFINLNNFFK